MLKRTLRELRIRSSSFSQIGQELTRKRRQQNLQNFDHQKKGKYFKDLMARAVANGCEKWPQISEEKRARHFSLGGGFFDDRWNFYIGGSK